MFRVPRLEVLRRGAEHDSSTSVVVRRAGRQIIHRRVGIWQRYLIRWADDVPNLEELIVTTVIRDAMLASFHSAMGRRFRHIEQVVINTLPDPTILLHPRVVTATNSMCCIQGEVSGLELLFSAISFKADIPVVRGGVVTASANIVRAHRRQRHRILDLLPA